MAKKASRRVAKGSEASLGDTCPPAPPPEGVSPLPAFTVRIALNKKKNYASGGGGGGGGPKKVRSFLAIHASEAFFSPTASDNAASTSDAAWEVIPRDVSDDLRTLFVSLHYVATFTRTASTTDDTLDLDVTVTNGDGQTSPPVPVPAATFEANPVGP